METLPAREAKKRFGQLLDSAQRGPVRVTKKGRPVGVMMSEAHYQQLRGAAWERLNHTVEAMHRDAADNGLDEDTLKALLSRED